jgi:hypothetical protein
MQKWGRSRENMYCLRGLTEPIDLSAENGTKAPHSGKCRANNLLCGWIRMAKATTVISREEEQQRFGIM